MISNISSRKICWLATTIVMCSMLADASESPSLRIANSFGKSMVLQRDMPVPIWGWARPQDEITVEFKGQKKTVHTDVDGRWRVILNPMPASAEPGELYVSSGNGQSELINRKYSDVLVGDVWLCAGPGIRRNMGSLQDARKEIARAKFPHVRILRPDSYRSIVPVADIPPASDWTVVSPKGIETYSVTWYLGRELHSAVGVPVGVILANMETDLTTEWLPWRIDPKDKTQAEALRCLTAQMPFDIARAEKWLYNMGTRRRDDPIDLLLFPSYIPYAFYNRHPVFDGQYPVAYKRSNVYNALIGPLIPMALRGIIINCEFESKHGNVAPDSIKELVETWRVAWGRPGLPFVVSEPVGKLERSVQDHIYKAVSSAVTLSNVVTVSTPPAFSEQKSDEYWKAVASQALKLPQETVLTCPEQTEWAQASPVKMDGPPIRRHLEAAHLFADNMVLQCDQPLKVWGWCESGEEVTVSIAGQSRTVIADVAGKWQVMLDALKAGETPLKMTIKGKADTLNFENVLAGEVWINSGQSNSGFVLSATLGFAEEQLKAIHPTIRYFANARAADVLPQRRNMGEWIVVSPETAGHMSGIGYYFARAIQRERHVPVGIIEANHGGSTILSWMSDAALTASPKFTALAADRARVRDEMLANLHVVEETVRSWAASARGNSRLERPVMAFPVDASPIRPFYGAFIQNAMNRRGCMFYNAMIYSMIGYGVKGAVWNQGEADTGNERTGIYDELMANMVADWRKSWGYDFAFYYVQMPAIKGRTGLLDMWPAQVRALTRIPKSGMIVCNDISEPERGEGGIHPRDKKTVGERLARLALVRTYGVKGMVDASPMMESVAHDGSRVVVTFSTPGDGLKTRDGKPSDRWELAGTDGKFFPARAELSGGTVILSADGVPKPVTVRLGWAPDSNCNLVNSAGLPALPFQAEILH